MCKILYTVHVPSFKCRIKNFTLAQGKPFAINNSERLSMFYVYILFLSDSFEFVVENMINIKP